MECFTKQIRIPYPGKTPGQLMLAVLLSRHQRSRICFQPKAFTEFMDGMERDEEDLEFEATFKKASSMGRMRLSRRKAWKGTSRRREDLVVQRDSHTIT